MLCLVVKRVRAPKPSGSIPGPDEHGSPADDDEGGENTRCRTPNVALYATQTHCCFNDDTSNRVVSFVNTLTENGLSCIALHCP